MAYFSLRHATAAASAAAVHRELEAREEGTTCEKKRESVREGMGVREKVEKRSFSLSRHHPL